MCDPHDQVITPHPRFLAFVANIRHRKGAKVHGVKTKNPMVSQEKKHKGCSGMKNYPVF